MNDKFGSSRIVTCGKKTISNPFHIKKTPNGRHFLSVEKNIGIDNYTNHIITNISIT